MATEKKYVTVLEINKEHCAQIRNTYNSCICLTCKLYYYNKLNLVLFSIFKFLKKKRGVQLIWWCRVFEKIWYYWKLYFFLSLGDKAHLDNLHTFGSYLKKHKHTDIHTQTHLLTHTHPHPHARMRPHTQARTHACAHTHARTPIRALTPLCPHPCVYTRTHTLNQ
jgi:hypothetical protein